MLSWGEPNPKISKLIKIKYFSSIFKTYQSLAD
jgi:hypothetical protein